MAGHGSRFSGRASSVMVAVNYVDDRTAYFVVEGGRMLPPEFPLRRVAEERQAAGELPAGEIRTVKPVR